MSTMDAGIRKLLISRLLELTDERSFRVAVALGGLSEGEASLLVNRLLAGLVCDIDRDQS